MSLGQVLGNVMNTAFATPAVADIAMDAFLQRREIQVAQFLSKDFAAKVQVNDEALKAFYESHKDLFQQAEQAKVEYVVLDLEAVRDGIELNEADLQTYYKENASRLTDEKEERRARHILLNAPRSMSADEREAVKAKAQIPRVLQRWPRLSRRTPALRLPVAIWASSRVAPWCLSSSRWPLPSRTVKSVMWWKANLRRRKRLYT